LYTAVFVATGLHCEVVVAPMLASDLSCFISRMKECCTLAVSLSCDYYFPGHPARMTLYSLIVTVCH